MAKLKEPKACKNCIHGEACDTYYGYTHCKLFNVSFSSDSKCKKHEREK